MKKHKPFLVCYTAYRNGTKLKVASCTVMNRPFTFEALEEAREGIKKLAIDESPSNDITSIVFTSVTKLDG